MRLIATALFLIASAEAHYHWVKGIAPGQTDTDFGFVRKPKNFQTNGFVGDVTSPDVRCNQLAGTTKVAAVTAGGTFGMTSDPAPYHPGPMQFYMAKVPEGGDVTTWDGAGQVWFKVHYEGPTFSPGQMNWPKLGTSVSFTIPKSLPNGDYLVRAEHIGLHTASASGPQLYIACAQVRVSGGGNGTPGPLVAFPGAYVANDQSLRININYPVPTTYTPPGPPVWKG